MDRSRFDELINLLRSGEPTERNKTTMDASGATVVGTPDKEALEEKARRQGREVATRCRLLAARALVRECDGLQPSQRELASDALFQALSDEDDRVRRVVAEALGKCCSDTTFAEMCQTIQKERSQCATGSAWALGWIALNETDPERATEAVCVLSAFIREHSRIEPGWACWALGKAAQGHEQARNCIREDCLSLDCRIRNSACHALASWASLEAFDLLIQRLNEDPETYVRRTACHSLSTAYIAQDWEGALDQRANHLLGVKIVRNLGQVARYQDTFDAGEAPGQIKVIGDQATDPLVRSAAQEQLNQIRDREQTAKQLEEMTRPPKRGRFGL